MQPWLVVGLGNPGPTYALHRHNVGYRVVEELATRLSARFTVARGIRSEVAEGRLGSPGPDTSRLLLAKSRTFMNETGGPVAKLVDYYKIDLTRLIVVHDELDIDPDKSGSSSAAATTVTTVSSPSGSPSAPVTTSGSGSASAGRPVVRIPPTSC